jgi:uncharacterized protein with NAD-binding domain and iron-sulfur cluster
LILKSLPQYPQQKKLFYLNSGGGLSGLSAALELAERGYSVTIKEKETSIGGKLFCRPVEIFPGQIFYVEHGFHGRKK